MRNFEATNAAIPVSLVFVPAVPVASKAIKAPVLDSAASSQGNDTGSAMVPRSPAPEPAKGSTSERHGDPSSQLTVPNLQPTEEPAEAAVQKGERSRYEKRVVERVSAQMRFPRQARNRHQSGTAMVRFSMKADGNLGWLELARSSGFGSLDHESENILRRATPFPPPPGQRPVSFTLPMPFHGRMEPK